MVGDFVAGDRKVQRNHEKIQEALTALRDVEASINELEYLERYLKSSNHSKELCKSTITLINDLNRTHADVVNALIYYGNQYGSCQVNLVNLNNPNYQPVSSYSEFTYEHAPEHQKSFWEKTWNQIVLGDFSDDTTWLGTTTNVILSFTGIDALLDARDFAGSASKGDGLGMVLNGISFLPIFGVIGEIGKAGKAAKHVDDIIDGTTGIIKRTDDYIDAGTTVVNKGDNIVKSSSNIPKNGGITKKSSSVLDNANFAQKTYNYKFSAEGVRKYSLLAGEPINNIDDLTQAIKKGKIKAKDLPIDYIVRDGNTIILNTRTSQALTRAGLPRSKWAAINRTGDSFFEELLDGQLSRNKLSSKGISIIKQSGVGK